MLKRTFANYLNDLIEFHEGPGQHPSGSSQDVHAGKSPHSPTRPAGDDPFDADPQIAALEKIGRDTGLDRSVRQKAFDDVRLLKQLKTAKYSDGSLIKTKIDELFASGANRIITKGPRAYLMNDVTKDKWTITTKLERDYADFKIRTEKFNMASYFDKLLEFHLGPGEHPSGSSQDVHAGDEAGSGAGEKTSGQASPVSLAEKKVSGLKKIEPKITELLSTKADENGGEMYGLHNKFKTAESMSRKITNDAREKNISIEEASDQINDGLRYTMIFGDKEYTAGVKQTEKELLDQGFERYDHKRKNFFAKENSMYQGYNTVWIDPSSGNTFEIQFHTDNSMRIKKAVHPLYEQFRISTSESERSVLANQMMQAWADPSYSKPVGYETLGAD